MSKPDSIELNDGLRIRILYEDRSVLAVDKPQGWILAPETWRQTGRNLFAAITSSLREGSYWARSRNLKYLRHVHRLDAETSGVLLLAKSPGSLAEYSRLFESRRVEKYYLAVVDGLPQRNGWRCTSKLADAPDQTGRIRVDPRRGKEAETYFQVLQTRRQATGPSTTLPPGQADHQSDASDSRASRRGGSCRFGR